MKFAFVSSMYGASWGGSEELWGSAALRLRAEGHDVFVGLIDWPGPAPKRDELRTAGCSISLRVDIPSLRDRVLNRIRPQRMRVLNQNPVPGELLRFHPDLVVISQMFTDDGLEWMEFCVRHELPYVTIVQAATEYQWPDDSTWPRLQVAYLAARRAFFVSRHNLVLCEKQIACTLDNAEIVTNPFSTRFDTSFTWPPLRDGRYKLACVGRIQPDAKGQDILIDVLADPRWRERPIDLTFFGNGCNRLWLEDYCRWRGVDVSFGGYISPQEIWASCHLLVHPTRKEGMPIVVIEAALCGRPVVTTATAGIPEFVVDGETGFIAPFANVAAFECALERAWSERTRWEEIGKVASDCARDRLPSEPDVSFANRLIELIR